MEYDCAVCLQKCQHPTKLSCGHVFCFLCVKGVAHQSRKCAMCRTEIPLDYFENPVLLDKSNLQYAANVDGVEGFQWYYEGRNGWWKYDERSNSELENAFNNGESECTLLLAGTLYIVDFQAMTQFRRSDHTRRRRVQRDTPRLPAKGIAGIRTNINQVPIEIKDETEDNVNENHDNAETEIIITDNVQNSNGSEHILNQNVSSVQSEDIDDVVSRISTLDLNNADSNGLIDES
ncbi:E3 ubiquitin-protein ligase rnf146 [Bombyx mandarina]|uniref:E3 ubiquitin-protein ligase n=2 Tax=Bombyx TaxID=7090 RepID=A0A8R1WKD3_BOMMO|nr:E3 ubiquitin-protein ligase rnf146 [Bombyx mori]XP_028029936.1 E3 ubiquitin-protein ligase rnf146 [Bombyx mandarina]